MCCSIRYEHSNKVNNSGTFCQAVAVYEAGLVVQPF